MGTYYLSDTVSDVFYLALTEAPGSTASATLSVPVQSTELGLRLWVSPSTEPGVLTWDTSGYSADIRVTAIGASTSIRLVAQRRRADLLTTSGSAFLAYQSGTGLKSFSHSWDPNVAHFADDRYAVRLDAQNTNMMTAESVTVEYNTSESVANVPWDVGGAPPPAAAMLDPLGARGFYGA